MSPWRVVSERYIYRSSSWAIEHTSAISLFDSSRYRNSSIGVSITVLDNGRLRENVFNGKHRLEKHSTNTRLLKFKITRLPKVDENATKMSWNLEYRNVFKKKTFNTFNIRYKHQASVYRYKKPFYINCFSFFSIVSRRQRHYMSERASARLRNASGPLREASFHINNMVVIAKNYTVRGGINEFSQLKTVSTKVGYSSIPFV